MRSRKRLYRAGWDDAFVHDDVAERDEWAMDMRRRIREM